MVYNAPTFWSSLLDISLNTKSQNFSCTILHGSNMLDIKQFSTLIIDSSLDIITVDEKFLRSKRLQSYLLDMILINYFQSGTSSKRPGSQ
jgi:hypothetical protein